MNPDRDYQPAIKPAFAEEAITHIIGDYIPISLTRAILLNSSDNPDKAYKAMYQESKVESKIILNVVDIVEVEDSYRTTGSSYISSSNTIRATRVVILNHNGYNREYNVTESAETVMKMIEEARTKTADRIVEYKNKIDTTSSDLI